MQIRYLYYVDNPALIDLYRSGTFLLYPSFYEASGLLHNEAMTFDCPVVVSDLPVMHEPCGDAALYCDPHDIASIVDTTTSVAERGYLQANQFTLKNQAKVFWIPSVNTKCAYRPVYFT